MHKYYEIGISPTQTIPSDLKSKAFVAYCDKNNNVKSCGGKWVENRLTANVRTFGNFSIMLDTEAPTIKPVSFKSIMTGRSKMTFKITDNIGTTGKARSLRYAGYVDDQWVLFEFDSKKNLLIHRFDDRIGKGSHQLRIEVRDDRNNLGLYEATFTR